MRQYIKMNNVAAVVALMAFVLLISSTAFAKGGRGGGEHGSKSFIDVLDDLDSLTDAQEDKLDVIEDKYEPLFKAARGDRDEEQELRVSEREEVLAILTSAQKTELKAIQLERYEKSSAQIIEKMTKKLDLSDSQVTSIEKIFASNGEKLIAAQGDPKEMKELQDAQMKAIEALLTDTQKTVFEKMSKKRGKGKPRS